MSSSLESDPSFYRYEPDAELHVIDCGGNVDLETGIERLRSLQRKLAARPSPSGLSRLLIDFRNTVWQGEGVHMDLSKLTRAELLHPGNVGIRAAILNNRWSGRVSDNEHWFLTEDDALDWLRTTIE
jgi:hypothetical protein